MLVTEYSLNHHKLASSDGSFVVELSVDHRVDGTSIHGKCRYPIWSIENGDPRLLTRFNNLDVDVARRNVKLIEVCRPTGEFDTLTSLAVHQDWLKNLGFVGSKGMTEVNSIIELSYEMDLPLILDLSKRMCERTRPFRLKEYDGGHFPPQLSGQRFQEDGTVLVSNLLEDMVHDADHLVGFSVIAEGAIAAIRGQRGWRAPHLKDQSDVGVAHALDRISGFVGTAVLGKNYPNMPIEERLIDACKFLLRDLFNCRGNQNAIAEQWTRQTLDLIEFARALPPYHPQDCSFVQRTLR